MLRFPSRLLNPTVCAPPLLSSLRTVRCLCTRLRCLALCTAEVSHISTASFVSLNLDQKSPCVSFCPLFFLPVCFISVTVSIFHPRLSSLATTKYLSHRHIESGGLSLLPCCTVMCLKSYIGVYIWLLWSIATSQLCRPLTHIPLSFLHHSQRAVHHPRWVWMCTFVTVFLLFFHVHLQPRHSFIFFIFSYKMIPQFKVYF